MPSDQTLTQCKLERKVPGEPTTTAVAWIATKLAVKNKEIEFRGLEGSFKVTEVYETHTEEEIDFISKAFKHQKKFT